MKPIPKGKKGKGLLPVISNMPKDNHSLMQLYLDGFKKNFYTFFFVQDSTVRKVNNNNLLIVSNIFAYIVLIIAVILGTAANGFAKGANGFTLIIPSILTAITIVGCMFTLSIVMKTVPVGITYASFAGLCIIATTIVGVYKFNQMPDLYTIIGLALIISGVLIVNLLGKTG